MEALLFSLRVFPSCVVVATSHFPEATVFNNDPFRHDELQRRLEGVGWQLLIIEESLQALQIGPFGLSFANDDVACGGHLVNQRAGCGTPE